MKFAGSLCDCMFCKGTLVPSPTGSGSGSVDIYVIPLL